MNPAIPWMGTLIVLGAALILFWQRRLNRLKGGQQNLGEVLETSRQLFNLVVNLQQHRGMSSAWLSGDAGFLPRIREKQALIDTLFPALQRDARREGARYSPCFSGNEFSLFIFRWHSLVETLANKQPEQSIAEHGQLIALVLNWLAALGEARLEPLAGGGDQVGRVCNYARRLPTLTECLGQARAIGSSVAARRACSPVDRVRLMFLIGRAEALLEQATQANDGGQVTVLARTAIRDLTHTVRTSMLLSDGISVSPESYFSVATKAIDSVVAWIAQSGNQLQSLTRAGGSSFLAVAVVGGPR